MQGMLQTFAPKPVSMSKMRNLLPKLIRLLVLSGLLLPASGPVFADGADSCRSVRPLASAGPDGSRSRASEPAFTVQLHGTVRAKFEYQPDLGQSRFQVRNARFSVSGSDKVNTSNFENPIATIEGRISNGTLQASLRLSNETRQIDFQFLGNQIAFDEANILDIQIEHDAIVGGPEINGREIVFYVHPQTDMSSLELAPVLTLSKGASSMPASGATIDFAQYKDYTVEYTVIAENLSTNIYSVVIKQGGDLSLSSFENWVSESSSYSDLLRPTPNWATSNLGIESIRSLGILMGVNYTGGPVVLQEENGYQGHGAKVVTANTIGGASLIPGVFPSIPVITSGSLFTGDFVVDAMNTLNSTQFGIPYFQKPTNVKGYFKYTPGENYYYCKDPSVSNEAEIDNTKTDECSLCAVLYEVENYDDFLNGETIYTSDKIVAIAQQFAGNTPDYTAFDLQLEYKKEYDPTKKYRFAIIFSSSKDGAAFSGAEGSTLWIDEVEVINE